MGGACWRALHLVRKRIGLFFVATVALALFTCILLSVNLASDGRVVLMEQRLAEMQLRAQYFESLHRSRLEDVMKIENEMLTRGGANVSHMGSAPGAALTLPTLSPEFTSRLKNFSGSAAAAGFEVRHLAPLRLPPLAYQLLPHLLADPHSARPAFHMRGRRTAVDVVIGVPSVRRDKESYLVITLTQLVQGISAEEEPSVLIVVLLGETDPEVILQTAHQIETMFSKQVKSGLIEVLAPRASFYPDLDHMPATLGDSTKRFKWRTKQNLDIIFLMSYCRLRGTFYLMLEDDIIAKKNYITEIKKFAAEKAVVNPSWLVIEFCRVGGIGKLFRSSELLSFITYVQLFYTNLPIDWLIESYLADKACTIDKTSKKCVDKKLDIRPRYHESLFQHIGLYSSLSGKIQKIKDNNFGTVPQFIPHDNPPLISLRTTIKTYSDHTIHKAYAGKSFFWGLSPKKGDFIEFTFVQPIYVKRYRIASGSVEHVSDKLYSATVAALPAAARSTAPPGGEYTELGGCDELGVCEAAVPERLGALAALRLTLQRDSSFWLIISEILIEEKKNR